MSAWIKMRTDLRDDKRVMRIADQLNLPDATIIGAFFILWAYADTHSTDGRLGITAARVDKTVGVPGFAEAAAHKEVNWLAIDSAGLCSIPRFTTHNGQSAKKRAEDASRKASKRGGPERPQSVREKSPNRPKSVRDVSAKERTDSGQVAELDKSKKREEREEEKRESEERAQNTARASEQAPAGIALASRQTGLAPARPPEFDMVRVLRAWWPKSDEAYTLAGHPNATPARVCWLAQRVRNEKPPRPPGFIRKGIVEGWPVPPEWLAKFERATGTPTPQLKLATGASA